MAFGKNRLAMRIAMRLTMRFKFIWIFLAMLLTAAPGWAINVVIAGGSTNSASPTLVSPGDSIYITGSCKQESWHETRRWARYIIYSGSSFKVLSGSSITSWLDNSSQNIVVGTTPLTDGTDFRVGLQCTDHVDKKFLAAVFFRVAPPSPPMVTADTSNARFAKDDILIKVHAAGTGDGVKEVFIQWPGAPGDTERMTHVSGDLYQYTIPAGSLPEGAVDVQVWANSEHGANKGWESIRGFTVDKTAPSIQWDSANAAYAKDEITINADVVDGASGVKDVWIKWTGEGSTNIQMTKGRGNRYAYTIPSLPEGAKDVEIRATDNAGNSTGWIGKGRFTVDKSAPSVTWDQTNAVYTNGGITINAYVHDAISGVQDVWITWTGETGKNIKMDRRGGNRYSHVIPALPDGVKQVQIWAADRAGNGTGWVGKGSFIVDSTAPAIDWLTPLDQAMFSGDSIRIAGNLTEENPDYVTIGWQSEDETAWHSHIEKIGAGGNSFEYDLPGLKRSVNYRLRVQATDKAGNVSDAAPVRTVIGQLPANVLFENSAFLIVDHSLADKDDSGGFSRGDDLIYAVELQTGKIAAQGLSLRYALPAGLSMRPDTTPDTRPYFAPASAISDGTLLNAHWNGAGDAQLLADGVDLAANSKLVIHIPVAIAGRTIASPVASPIVSTVLAGAGNAKDDLQLEHQLALQEKFPADRALDLEFTSLQPDWKYRQGSAFNYRIALRVRAWDLSNVALRYALPPGLEKNGEARLEGDGAAAVKLNPAWGNNGEGLLLSSLPGVMLTARHSLSVVIPVKVAAKAVPGSTVQSEIEADASNLSGPATARHHIVLDSTTGPEEQLMLKKTVDNQTALPGQTLRYTITYANVGIDDLHDLVIRDTFQSEYLTLGHAQCGPVAPRTLRCGLVAGSAPGVLEWHLDGTLEAGDFGSVSYGVVVNER